MSSSDGKSKKPKVKVKLKASYRTQVILGIIGGTILFVVGAVGSAGFYAFLINQAISMNIIPAEYGSIVLLVLTSLALGGGLTVIAGSLLIPKARRFGDWLIGIGAGISLVALLVRIFFLGPMIQSYISRTYENIVYLFEAFRLLGVEIGLVGIGVIISFMATFREYRWTIIIGGMSFFSMLAGLSGDPRIFAYIKTMLGTPSTYGAYIDYIVRFLLYVGAVLLVTALLAGAGYIKLSKIVVVLCLVATLFSFISIVLDLQALKDYLSLIALFQYVRLISALLVYWGGIYFLRRA